MKALVTSLEQTLELLSKKTTNICPKKIQKDNFILYAIGTLWDTQKKQYDPIRQNQETVEATSDPLDLLGWVAVSTSAPGGHLSRWNNSEGFTRSGVRSTRLRGSICIATHQKGTLVDWSEPNPGGHCRVSVSRSLSYIHSGVAKAPSFSSHHPFEFPSNAANCARADEQQMIRRILMSSLLRIKPSNEQPSSLDIHLLF